MKLMQISGPEREAGERVEILWSPGRARQFREVKIPLSFFV